MSIRELKKEDVAGVDAIFDLYWEGDFRRHLSERLAGYLRQDAGMVEQGFKFFVAEDEGEVVGVAAMRRLPAHMQQYAKTDKPLELYLNAVRTKRKGIGSALRDKRLEEGRKLGYTEALLFSGETHQDAWTFHDHSGLERVGPATAPNGEVGYIWRKELS
jgi:predicted N-acetyltransferase YhbS